MNIIELQKTNGISICSMEKICTVGTVVAGYGTEPTQPVRNLELNQIEDYSTHHSTHFPVHNNTLNIYNQHVLK